MSCHQLRVLCRAARGNPTEPLGKALDLKCWEKVKLVVVVLGMWRSLEIYRESQMRKHNVCRVIICGAHFLAEIKANPRHILTTATADTDTHDMIVQYWNIYIYIVNRVSVYKND